MQTAIVLGKAISTVKHPSLEGWRLLLIQPTNVAGDNDGFPFLAIDDLGTRTGDRIFFTSDGKHIRQMVGRNDCPVRYAIQGIIDNSSSC